MCIVTLNTMTETIRDRALAALEALRNLRHTIPRDLWYIFRMNGITLQTALLEPIQRIRRPTCIATSRRGTPCRKRACTENVLCMQHARPTCTAITLKGDPCTHKTYKTLTMCKRHAKSAGLLVKQTECSVCYCQLTNENRIETECNHSFCHECLESWGRTRGTLTSRSIQTSCPMCRQTIRVPFRRPSWWGAQTGREWIHHLNIIPCNPLWTPVETEDYALDLGKYIMSVAPRVMSDDEISIYIRAYGFTRR